MKSNTQWRSIMFAMLVGSLMYLPNAMASQETLVLSVNPALPGTATTATVAMENIADIETLSLELSFAAGTALTLPVSNWFSRDGYFPQSPFGTVPTVELNDIRAAAIGKQIHISGFGPSGTSGRIGVITFNVNPGALAGDAQVLSLSGRYFSKSEQTVKNLSSVSAIFTVGSLPNITCEPTLKLFNPVDVGSQSTPQSVILKNTGIADLVIGTLYISGTNAAEFTISNDLCSGQIIPPGQQATVGIIFAPLSEGIKTANLSIPSNDPDTETLTVMLKISREEEPFVDSDNDGIPDDIENAGCTDAFDADTDDDGIADGAEDANHNGIVDVGETNPCNIDTDGDLIQDGTEIGLTLVSIGLDTDTGVFHPDLDNTTTTDPLDMDSDNDGIKDGEEDSNQNGRVDAGETDPNERNANKINAMPWIQLLL